MNSPEDLSPSVVFHRADDNVGDNFRLLPDDDETGISHRDSHRTTRTSILEQGVSDDMTYGLQFLWNYLLGKFVLEGMR